MALLLFLIGWLGLAQAEAPAPKPLPDRLDQWLQSVVLLVTGPSWCSGVVIDDKGTVATAYHCVASGQRSEVRLRGGDKYIGKTFAVATKDDLALIAVPELAGKVPGLNIREGRPRQGERVYGLGHPFAPVATRSKAMKGMLLWSVSEGIVSAVGTKLIQTDAALNPGNSGGPVVDEQGRIIGITSRKLGGDNIAFLASANRLRMLIAKPVKPSAMGGQFSIGFATLYGVDQHEASTVEVVGSAIIRDRVVIRGAYGLGADGGRSLALERGSSWYPEWELTAGLRQRFGRGSWSTALDFGAGLMGTQGLTSDFDLDTETWLVLGGMQEISPSVGGQFHNGGLVMRVVVLPWGRGGVVTSPAAQQAAREAKARAGGLGYGPGDPVWMLALELDLPGVISTF